MTAPRAAIVFNASTGSDTAASGLGPATAISGTAAAHTGGSASTTITLTGSPDLSGVQAGDLLWLKTASGRQFSVIASADNSAKTVTVDDSFTIAEASAVNYAIGGKRATLDNADSRLLFTTDAKAAWIIETETDQTINTSALTVGVSGDTTNGRITFRGDSATTRRVINQTANAANLDLGAAKNYWLIENLKFTCSNGTKTNSVGIKTTIYGHVVRNCIFGDATNKLGYGLMRNASSTSIRLVDCEILQCTSAGINWHQWSGAEVINCWIHDNAAGAIGSPSALTCQDTIIEGNTGDGWNQASAGLDVHIRLINCTIHGNGGDGIDLQSSVVTGLVIRNCNITANGGYGIRAYSGQANFQTEIDYNNFGTGATANTSGDRLNLNAGAHDLNVDPQYTDAANGDFSVGTNVRAKGFPDATRYIGANQSATRSYVDIGAAQRQEPAGGGGGGNRIFGSGIITPLEMAG